MKCMPWKKRRQLKIVSLFFQLVELRIWRRTSDEDAQGAGGAGGGYKLHILPLPSRDYSLIVSAPQSHRLKTQTGFIGGADQYQTREDGSMGH